MMRAEVSYNALDVRQKMAPLLSILRSITALSPVSEASYSQIDREFVS